jgi:hypothetical protein
MVMKGIGFLSAAAAALCLASCMVTIDKGRLLEAADGETPDVVDEDAALQAVTEYCEMMFGVYCRYFNGCCTVDERNDPAIQDTVIDIGNDCEHPPQSQYYRNCFYDIGGAVNAGQLSVDIDDLHLCRNVLETSFETCFNLGTFFAYLDAALADQCRNVLVGLVPQGETCRLFDECAPGLYCGTDSRCSPAVGSGGECTEDFMCEMGTTCLPDGGCGLPSMLNQACAEDGDCGLALFCNPGTRLCADLISAGSSCTTGTLTCKGMCQSGTCQDFCNGP